MKNDYQQWYEMLRDAIMEHLEPQDGDEAEIDILCRAVEAAGKKRVSRHRYDIGEYVTLTDGLRTIILSQWWEDNGTLGYGVRLVRSGATTGIHESQIRSRTRRAKAPPAGEGGRDEQGAD